MRHSNGTSCLGERCAQTQGADHRTPRHRPPPPRSSAAATGLLRGEGGGRATHAAQRAPTPLPEGQSPPPPPAPATKAASASAPQPPAEPYFGAAPRGQLAGSHCERLRGGKRRHPHPTPPKHRSRRPQRRGGARGCQRTGVLRGPAGARTPSHSARPAGLASTARPGGPAAPLAAGSN